MHEQYPSNRGPWIIAGGLVAAAAIISAALILISQQATERRKANPTLPARVEDFNALEWRAQDRAAQSNLRNALVAAKTYYAENGTYAGFDAAAGQAIEPTLSWTDDLIATENRVSVNYSDASSIALSTLSASGQPFCIGDGVEGTYYGTTDAHATTCMDSGWESE